jgi:type II pantothenate kinase
LIGDETSQRGKKMCVMATGGGSYKFYERMKKELKVEVIQEDEMECLIVGITLPYTEEMTRRTRLFHSRDTE